MEEYKDRLDQPFFEQIEAYLLNSLLPEEKAAFEAKLAADPSLLKAVELRRQLLAQVPAESFRAETKAALKTGKPRLAGIRSINKWWWVAAAMLILISGLWYRKYMALSPQQLANHYFSPDPGLPVTLSGTRQYQFYDGMVSYKEADYDKAIASWRSIPATKGLSDTLDYYIGVAYLNKDQYNDALQQLLPLAEANGKLKEKASWYLALTYLKLNQPRKAQKFLQSISTYPQADELLEDINQFIGE
ncbi:tetratricopeptide repeat protein [Flavihumibacter sp. CACIAM 22H1]|uniref:tetratricopeptide repeat protein n=1 Tax=Flavihumibacter sp. CACIAM 22H1 TaxID=1812911 RepID=UPI0007A91F28|nr:tetratricopeptide repeat protein [Flavihumibacter sp. CACIAM 22H1]KYP15244.1 MAG: hypothetical protein A1D16_15145 [Flavihumibacter sp. CACIAM 22H1]